MDSQRPFLYLSLLFLGFLVWQAWQTDHAPPPPVVEATSGNPAVGSAQQPVSVGADVPESSAASVSSQAVPIASAPAVSNATLVHVKTDVLDVTISTRGGDIVSLKLPSYPISLKQKDTPLEFLSAEEPYIAQSGLLHDKTGINAASRAPNHYAIYENAQSSYELTDQNELKVPLRWISEDGVAIEKVFTFRPGQFVIDVDYQIQNGSATDWVGRQYNQLRRGEITSESSMLAPTSYMGGAYYTGKFEKLKFDDMQEEPLNQTVTGGWVSMLQHYFVSAWIPSSAEQSSKLYSKVVSGTTGNEYILGMSSADSNLIAAGQTGSFSSRLYAGPKLQDDMAKLIPGLELTIDYGIFTIFSKPLFWLLSHIHGLVGNWGWAIIFLTILIKVVFFKLSEASYRSMAKMRKVAPKIKSLKDRFGADKQGHQKAMMELYKKEKINPLGGCLPILIQIPVFIALYWVLIEAVELRQAPWALWIQDLSIKDPFFILPVIMGVSMFVQQKLNPPQPDPMMQKMMMAMPFVFTIFFAFFASGLVLYWVVNNLLSISQQWYITRSIENEGK
ncbi:MAG TPA: membrane protein insertase YidC [Gammaproteobacteria bacterium]|nr:membrane protein insertase YidC [Gammaproteobacteria bacterium]